MCFFSLPSLFSLSLSFNFSPTHKKQTKTKKVNVDFADVKAIMRDSGTAMLGVGVASGKGRAREAADAATSAPLIERSIERATGVVYNITGGKDMTLAEVNEVSQVVSSLADPAANVIFGAVRRDFFGTFFFRFFSRGQIGFVRTPPFSSAFLF